MEKIKLAIIFGGKSSEYPVSLHSAGSLIHKINKEHYELIFIGISKDGKWYAYDGDVVSSMIPGCVRSTVHRVYCPAVKAAGAF